MTGRFLFVTLAVVLLVAFLLVALTASQQSRLLFFPTHHLTGDPRAYNLNAEPLSIRTPDGPVLDGWWVKAGGRVALLYFHGNAGNISDRYDRVQNLVEALGLDVFLVRLPRIWKEHGQARRGRALRRRARDLRRGRRARLPGLAHRAPGRVARSVGRARDGAAKDRRRGRSRDAVPFDPRDGGSLLPLDSLAVGPVPLRQRRQDRRLRVPVLIAQAENDDIVPPEQTRRLFELARPPKTYFVLSGAQHNDIDAVRGPTYRAAWQKFLDDAAASR